MEKLVSLWGNVVVRYYRKINLVSPVRKCCCHKKMQKNEIMGMCFVGRNISNDPEMSGLLQRSVRTAKKRQTSPPTHTHPLSTIRKVRLPVLWRENKISLATGFGGCAYKEIIKIHLIKRLNHYALEVHRF